MNTPAESKGVRQGTAHEQITKSSLFKFLHVGILRILVSCRTLPYPSRIRRTITMAGKRHE
jgi:hypothetical protein